MATLSFLIAPGGSAFAATSAGKSYPTTPASVSQENAPAGRIADTKPGLTRPLTDYTAKAACGPVGPRQARCDALVVTAHQTVPTANPDLPSGYGPADLASAYDINTTAGNNETVAIVDAYGDADAAADLAVYRYVYGLPVCNVTSGCFKVYNENGARGPLPANNSGWATEQSLDIEMVSAVCPLCKIALFQAASSSISDLATAVESASKLAGVVAISNSYAAGEFSGETSYDTDYNHGGSGLITVTASSGDAGYGTGYPAASPDVVAVGGTALSTATNARGWTETAWSGAGSGCSAYEAKPVWQTDTGCANRTIADTSAVADPSTPVAIYDTDSSGGWGLEGGTSVASPIVASISAEAGDTFRASPGAEGFYQMQTGYGINDVTSGNNGSCTPSYLCTAGIGYDGPTGVGTPYTSPRSSVAYATANLDTTASYAPAVTYNAYGLTNEITRNGVGSYTVEFPGMADGGTVNVTAYGSANAYCDPVNWGQNSGNEIVNVSCHNGAGTAVNSEFEIGFVNPAGVEGYNDLDADSLGYVWASEPTTSSYTPASHYSYNNLGSANSIVRNSTGNYTVNFTALAPTDSSEQGTVKISAYGATTNTCDSGGWAEGARFDEAVTVECYNSAGAPADTDFVASYAADLALSGNSTQSGYVWNAADTIPTEWSYNSTGGANSIVQNSTGNYSVTFGGLNRGGGNAQATGYNAGDSRCVVTSVTVVSGSKVVGVQCVNAAGTPTNTDFNLQYTT